MSMNKTTSKNLIAKCKKVKIKPPTRMNGIMNKNKIAQSELQVQIEIASENNNNSTNSCTHKNRMRIMNKNKIMSAIKNVSVDKIASDQRNHN